MVHGRQLPVEPEVDVDHRDALELVGLPEVGHVSPGLCFFYLSFTLLYSFLT